MSDEKHPDFAMDPRNHGKPLWVVYGKSPHWPQVLCCKLLAYAKDHRLLEPGTRHDSNDVVCIWGYSVYRRQPGFRTLGIAVDTWVRTSEIEWGPFFYGSQVQAFAKLREVLTPKAGAR